MRARQARANRWRYSHRNIATVITALSARAKTACMELLNGIDGDVWDPEIDRVTPKNYSITATDGKAKCRRAMLAEFSREEDGDPILAYIGQLAEHSASEQN